MQTTFAVADGIQVLQMLLAGFNTKKNFESGFYFYFAGRSLGQLLGLSITGADKWGDLGLITPMKPWERYIL